MDHKGAEKKPKKKNYHKDKKEALKLKLQPTQVHKKDIKNEKCYSCNKTWTFC